ncbi:hypothetical protein OPT61_g10407 [Boeremia exigua]|uniref:Uncharacterized protein n=1 Tax=Boeremia exigua TaxID=749465 RepID=A0ACC2HPT4_9PLEO|nr:hypothetical protein OPT61_g10407 [Boeremia exigua]
MQQGNAGAWKGDGPLKARCTPLRMTAARAVDAAEEGGPPEDGGFDDGWLMASGLQVTLLSAMQRAVLQKRHAAGRARLSRRGYS